MIDIILFFINNYGTTQTQVTLTVATIEGTTSLVTKACPETDDKKWIKHGDNVAIRWIIPP